MIGDDRSWARFFFEAKVSNHEGLAEVAAGCAEVSYQCATLPTGTSVEEFAEAVMKRHIRQGVPDVSVRLLGGRSTTCYSWTNGVQDIDTWFFTEGIADYVRIDVVTAPAFTVGSAKVERSRLAAKALLDGIVWIRGGDESATAEL